MELRMALNHLAVTLALISVIGEAMMVEYDRALAEIMQTPWGRA